MAQYRLDYDDRFPPASTPRGGWVDALDPYLKSAQIFQCTLDTIPGQPGKTVGTLSFNPKRSGITDYYFNAQLQGREEATIESMSPIIMLGDGNNGQETTDASYSKFELPEAWRTDKSSPAYRHNEEANYAFADGHVKPLKAEQVTSNFKTGKFYFEPR